MSVFDSSAILAAAFGEPGGDVALERLYGASAAWISSVNFAEVLTVIGRRGGSATIVERILTEADVVIDSFESSQARVAAELDASTKRLGLSLGDRACLALAMRLDLPVVTADRNWAKVEGLPVTLNFIR